MADIALEYDDLLDAGRNPWKRRLIALGAVAVVVAAATFLAWNQWMRGGSSTVAPVFTEATVTSGNVTKTISTSGTVAAQQTSNLNFATSGKVTKVDVTLGQQVKQGDVLAEIDPTNAQNALANAQASLASAQANLQQTLQGSTAAQLASADQSLVQAQTNYTNAVNAQQTLLQPPTASALGAAQQAMTAAQAQLQTAQAARTKLNTDAQAAVQTAQASVQKAQSALTSAQQAATNASENQQLAQTTLTTAEAAYCNAPPDPSYIPSFCSTAPAAPISISDANMMVTVAGGSSANAALAQKVVTADSGFRSAVIASQTASNSVTSAQNDLNTANTALATAETQPTQAQIAAADSAVTAAQAALDTANYNLSTLQAGPTQAQIASAQGAVDQASAGLKSAKASHDQAYAGSTAAQIQSARTAVQQAQVSVQNAQKTLDDTKLTAPFDGTIAALNTQVGDTAGLGSSASSSSADIVMNTPNQLVLNLTIAETDYPSVKAGDGGVATFSALSSQQFPFVIDSVGVNPTTTQGVVTYQAKAHIVTGAQAGPIFQALVGGFNRRGAGGAAANGTPGAAESTRAVGTSAADATPQATGTPGAAGTPGAGRTPRANRTPGAGGFGAGGGAFAQTAVTAQKPTPGMNATVTIIVDQRTNVVIVPEKAVQTKNRQSVVTVKNADGTTQDVTVSTGLSDTTNTEIISGLTEGQTIEIPGAAATTTTTQALPATGGFGGFGGGGGGGGGGFRGGGD